MGEYLRDACDLRILHVFFGPFDLVVIAALVAANVWRVRRGVRVRPLLFFLMALPLFGLVLPLVSMAFETERYMAKDAGVVVDAFETAYTLFRFPEYWAAGVIQVLVLVLGRRPERGTPKAAAEQAT